MGRRNLPVNTLLIRVNGTYIKVITPKDALPFTMREQDPPPQEKHALISQNHLSSWLGLSTEEYEDILNKPYPEKIDVRDVYIVRHFRAMKDTWFAMSSDDIIRLTRDSDCVRFAKLRSAILMALIDYFTGNEDYIHQDFIKLTKWQVEFLKISLEKIATQKDDPYEKLIDIHKALHPELMADERIKADIEMALNITTRLVLTSSIKDKMDSIIKQYVNTINIIIASGFAPKIDFMIRSMLQKTKDLLEEG